MWFDTCIKGGFAPFNSADYRHSNFDENGVLSDSDGATDADTDDEKEFSDDSVKTVISDKEKLDDINDSDTEKDDVIFNEKQAIEAAADVLSGLTE